MKICAIIVLYKQNNELLQKVINSIEPQVDTLLIIDNNENQDFFPSLEKCIYINLNGNKGIAYAQNVGIKIALENKNDYILLSDQDTIYPFDYIKRIFQESQGYEQDILTPVFYDEVKKEYGPIMIEKFKFIEHADKPIYVKHAIASGTIIKSRVFNEIGLMREDLFIDYVDFEWCWRACSNGFKVLCVPNVIIHHSLGDDFRKILGRKVCVRSNFRYFYMIRNGYYLSFHCKYLTLKEKTMLLKKTFLLTIAVFLLRPNFETIKLIFKAKYLGIQKKLV